MLYFLRYYVLYIIITLILGIIVVNKLLLQQDDFKKQEIIGIITKDPSEAEIIKALFEKSYQNSPKTARYIIRYESAENTREELSIIVSQKPNIIVTSSNRAAKLACNFSLNIPIIFFDNLNKSFTSYNCSSK